MNESSPAPPSSDTVCARLISDAVNDESSVGWHPTIKLCTYLGC